MKTALVCITSCGLRTGRVILDRMEDSVLFLPDHILTGQRYPERVICFKSPLRSIMGVFMGEYPQIVFIMAAGIVVRLIAPYLVDKRTDPAVVVMDEKGKNVISLLSGHLGGANALAERVALITNGRPVITTASDVQGKPAIDLVAEEFGCIIENPEKVPSFMRAFLDGQPVGIVDMEGIMGDSFKGYENVTFFETLADVEKSGISEAVLVSNEAFAKQMLSVRPLLLRPRNIIAGVGCRRGVTASEIEGAFKSACGIAGISPLALGLVATVDIKRNEQGLLDFAGKYRVPVNFYSVDQINMEAGEKKRENRVNSLIGANGVCEPCAALASGRGKLIQKKVKYRKRVTIALAPGKSERLQ